RRERKGRKGGDGLACLVQGVKRVVGQRTQRAQRGDWGDGTKGDGPADGCAIVGDPAAGGLRTAELQRAVTDIFPCAARLCDPAGSCAASS
ncbi:MAG TPA: hypothetical protein VKT77_07345, partial [Chthonomonadaceae bacterium]|nr:hypothetical protein [Chthonomonadaceae bacterium]